jgi:cathepsin F
MRTIYASAMLAASSLAFVSEDSEKEFKFMKYIAKFGQNYSTIEEFEHRFGTWARMDSFIELVNSPDSEYTHTAGHNQFSTWTSEEYNDFLTLQKPLKEGEDHTAQPLNTIRYTEEHLQSLGITSKLDWRETGCVSNVKDQGSCGSCWAFATTETMESAYCLNGGPLLTLSP